jgi:hypothetical protein
MEDEDIDVVIFDKYSYEYWYDLELNDERMSVCETSRVGCANKYTFYNEDAEEVTLQPRYQKAIIKAINEFEMEEV